MHTSDFGLGTLCRGSLLKRDSCVPLPLQRVRTNHREKNEQHFEIIIRFEIRNVGYRNVFIKYELLK